MKLLKSALMSIMLGGTILSAWSTYPAGYYNSLEGKCGKELRKAAKAIVARHTAISYSDGTWEAFKTTDTRVVNGKTIWWDMYSNNEVLVSSGHGGLNVEHSVANSWWGKTKNDAYKDLFHLNPSDSKANSAKGNYPLGEVSGTPTYDNGVTFVGSPKTGLGGGCTRVYEPADMYKGDFARVFFYMFTVYDDIAWQSATSTGDGRGRMYTVSGGEAELNQWATEMMLRWAEADGVSEKETNRNDAIYDIQHNRNPFIDLPILARHIWGDLKNTPFHLDVTDPEPVTPVDPTEPGEENNGILLNCDWDSASEISYYENLGWENRIGSGSFSGWFIKDFQGNNYASSSAYKGTGNGPFVGYLVSPVIEIPDNGSTVLTFRTQGAYGVSDSNLKVYILRGDTFDADKLEEIDAAICTPNANGVKPVYSYWLESGSVDLSDYPGNARLVWRYESARCGSDNSATYCLDDVLVKTDGVTTGIVSAPVSRQPYELVEGGIDAAESVMVFDITGRMVASGAGHLSLPKGLYIIVSNSTTSKIMMK